MFARPNWLTRKREPGQPLLALKNPCWLCRSQSVGLLCSTCEATAAPVAARCQRCALPLLAAVAAHTRVCGGCVSHPPPLSACAAALSYAPPWQSVIGAFKFSEQPGLARALARRMWADSSLRSVVQNCDALVPMPLSRERLAQRGYNQALELAKPLARWAAQALDSRSLLRLHERPPQYGLGRAARVANVRGVFAVAPERIDKLAGQRLCLVDDVMTSGASLHAAAQTLLQAGAASVSAVVLARTANPQAEHA